MLAVPAGAGGCGHQSFLQDRSERLPRDSHFMEEENETSSSLNCLDPGTGPRGAWRCSWTSAAPSLRPRTSALGQERPEAHFQDLRQPLPKSVLSLAFSFLPVPRN